MKCTLENPAESFSPKFQYFPQRYLKTYFFKEKNVFCLRFSYGQNMDNLEIGSEDFLPNFQKFLAPSLKMITFFSTNLTFHQKVRLDS